MGRFNHRAFAEEVHRQLGFLVTEFGFLGPDAGTDGWVAYHDDPLRVAVSLDHFGQDRGIDIMITLRTADGKHLNARIEDLVIAAGLGSAQAIRGGGQTRRAAIKAVATATPFLRTLLPILRGPDAAALIRRATA